jgi:hypothetical protein
MPPLPAELEGKRKAPWLAGRSTGFAWSEEFDFIGLKQPRSGSGHLPADVAAFGESADSAIRDTE